MSRPRGPRRVYRPQEREEIVAITRDVWRRYCNLSARLPIHSDQYRQIAAVVHKLVRLLELVGEQPRKTHSIGSGPHHARE